MCGERGGSPRAPLTIQSCHGRARRCEEAKGWRYTYANSQMKTAVALLPAQDFGLSRLRSTVAPTTNTEAGTVSRCRGASGRVGMWRTAYYDCVRVVDA